MRHKEGAKKMYYRIRVDIIMYFVYTKIIYTQFLFSIRERAIL